MEIQRVSIRWPNALIVGSLAVFVLALSGFTAVSLFRPPPRENGDTLLARSGIACPPGQQIYDPNRLQQEIDEKIRLLAERSPAIESSEMRRSLISAQVLICQFILQNPRRGLAYAQLLAVTPEAQTNMALFSALLQTSFDLARLDADAVRGRLVLAAPHWKILSPSDRQIVRADAESLMRTHLGVLEYPELLGRLGPDGGPELRTIFRAAVIDNWAERLPFYDDADTKAAAAAQ